jgi:hypothetical protein
LWYCHTHSQFPPFIIKNISWGFSSHSFVLTLFFCESLFYYYDISPVCVCSSSYSENDFFASRKVPFIALCALIISSNVIFWQLNQLHTYMRGVPYGFENGAKKWKHSKSTQIFVVMFQPFLYLFFYFETTSICIV